MKAIILISLAVTMQAQAAVKCVFGDDSWTLRNEDRRVKVVSEIDMVANKKAPRLTNQQKYWVIRHITREYGNDMTIAKFYRDEVVGYHNDLSIIYFYSYIAKRYYAIIHSYPGDNEYGEIVEVRSNRIVATIEDGYISCL